MTIELIVGDCVAVTDSLHDASIDLTVTSPPYDSLRDYTNEGHWNFCKFEQLAEELYRVTADGGVVVWNVSDQTINGSETGSSFRQALFFVDCGFRLADTMIYQKANNGGARGSNKTYTQAFEYMFVFSKGPMKTVNLIRDRPNKRAGEVSKAGGGRTKDGRVRATRTIVTEAFGKRSNIWTYPTQQDYWSQQHPAAMPLAMAKDHITSWTKEGDTVFDPFTGCGTSAVAAATLNRNFIGCDVSKDYLDIADQRLVSYYPVLKDHLKTVQSRAPVKSAIWALSEDQAKVRLGELSEDNLLAKFVLKDLVEHYS